MFEDEVVRKLATAEDAGNRIQPFATSGILFGPEYDLSDCSQFTFRSRQQGVPSNAYSRIGDLDKFLTGLQNLASESPILAVISKTLTTARHGKASPKIKMETTTNVPVLVTTASGSSFK